MQSLRPKGKSPRAQDATGSLPHQGSWAPRPQEPKSRRTPILHNHVPQGPRLSKPDTLTKLYIYRRPHTHTHTQKPFTHTFPYNNDTKSLIGPNISPRDSAFLHFESFSDFFQIFVNSYKQIEQAHVARQHRDTYGQYNLKFIKKAKSQSLHYLSLYQQILSVHLSPITY